MKVCIVGAGAIGGLFAAWLAPQHTLSVYARGATLAALRSHGQRWTDAQGVTHAVPVRASDQVQDLGPQDLIVLAVKGPALPSVATAVQALSHESSQVLVAMNGVPWWFFDGLGGPCNGLRLQATDATGALAKAIPTRQVLGCVVHLSSAVPEPGLVRHNTGNTLIIGEPAGGTSARALALQTLLNQGGFNTSVSERIQRDIWFKLWGNMTMNPISAITGATVDRLLDDPLVRSFCSAVMVEAQGIGAAIGIPIDQDVEQRHAVTRKLGAFKTSMLQDVEATRTIELDGLVSAVREVGQHLGLATPNIDALLGLTRVMAQTRGLYPQQTS
jgi:2-dehydropantoate 2-reductase